MHDVTVVVVVVVVTDVVFTVLVSVLPRARMNKSFQTRGRRQKRLFQDYFQCGNMQSHHTAAVLDVIRLTPILFHAVRASEASKSIHKISKRTLPSPAAPFSFPFLPRLRLAHATTVAGLFCPPVLAHL